MAEASGAGGGSSSGSSSNTAAVTPTAPALNRAVDVVVLDSIPRQDDQNGQANCHDDFWLSTVDGRFSSAPIPVRVGDGKGQQTFYVHKDVLLQSEWFRKALLGGFKESIKQAVYLPEEDPAIFHFVIAFLYEKQFNPVKALSEALELVPDKGKRREQFPDDSSNSDAEPPSDSASSSESDIDQLRRRRQRRRVQAETARLRQKQPGQHREHCQCPGCYQRDRPRCWNCGALPSQPPPAPRVRRVVQRPPIQFGFDEEDAFTPGPATPGPAEDPVNENNNDATPGAARTRRPVVPEETGGLTGHDLQTWLMTYELVLQVYVCANRFLMEDFKRVVLRRCVDMLETAGVDAAQPKVLQLCQTLMEGVPESDLLLKMVLARVGFLQPLLWKHHPTTTQEFLKTSPEVATMMLRETVMRHDADTERSFLPSMEKEKRKTNNRRRTRRYVGEDTTFRY